MKQRIRIHKAEPNTGSLDFSLLLDAPAGKHGFVTERRGHFYFEDGQRAKFLGFSLATRSNTPDHATAEKIAARFASMGVNVVRLHAADAPVGEPCTWSSAKDSPLLDYSTGTSRVFGKEGLDRFEYLYAKLREKGIYLHIDLMVAREFLPGDELDYPGGFPECAKCYPTFNERLIELQQEYARNFLTHVNPYTGLAIIDDPAVMTIQISNEESAIKGTDDTNGIPWMQPYRDERKKRFNDFLLAKYYTRKRLAEAWTFEDQCGLRDDEDPERGTVEVVEGGFYQPVNEPMGDWRGPICPARYADYMEFGLMLNQRYYQRMKDFLRSLGARVPIACSNLAVSAADVYGHSVGEVMECDSYFNHPIPPFGKDPIVAGPMEYVSTNPLTMQRGFGAMGNNLVTLSATAVIRGKAFTLAEWNEYGLYPFHSTAGVHTVAYACLNDWDALILYNHHTSEKYDDEPADEIGSVFNAYNDPSFICQWGFMASVFLGGLVKPSCAQADVVYTQSDLRTLPNMHMMPLCFLPYVMGTRGVYLNGGEQYQGDAQVAVNAGFLNSCDLADADHGVYYAWSPYRDAYRRAKDAVRLPWAKKNTEETTPGVHLGKQSLVFDDIASIAGSGDYREFAKHLDNALKAWGVISENTGYVDGKLISATGELVFDPDNARFSIHTPYCAFFSGKPEENIVLCAEVSAKVSNDRISLFLLPVGQKALSGAKAYLLTAMSDTGMDETVMFPVQEMYGVTINMVKFGGKLYMNTMEGTLTVAAPGAKLMALNPVGEEIAEVEGQREDGKTVFTLTGEIPAAQFRLEMA